MSLLRKILDASIERTRRSRATHDGPNSQGRPAAGAVSPLGAPNKASAADTTRPEGLAGLARELHGQGRIDEAVEAFRRALQLRPGDVDCLINIGACELARGDFVAAESWLRQAIALDAQNPDAWSNLGAALGLQDRYDEAIEALQRAERLAAPSSDRIDAYVNLAKALEDSNRTADALSVLEANLADRPNIDAQIIYAHALLRSGRLREGWDAYEFRWMAEPLRSIRMDPSRPLWNGQDLRGKTILLRGEQGLGDMVQFARYAAKVKALGATVLLAVNPELETLLSGCPGVDRVLPHGRAWPEFDYYINLMSLPRVFETELGSIPAEHSYLQGDASRAGHWRRRLADDAQGALKVGVVWRGDPKHVRDRYRSIPMRDFASHVAVEGVRLFSMQKGFREGEPKPESLGMMDLAAELADFNDTAALICELDVVVCVDTAVAHLAGALGAEVWLLAPTPADWRWLERTETSPWYPTMRIFRQIEPRDWTSVLQRVSAALRERVEVVAPNRVSRPASAIVEPIDHAPAIAPARHFARAGETRYGIMEYLPDEPVVGESLRLYGELLQPELDRLARLVAHGGTGLEIGAGVGAHALFLARALGSSGRLYVVESRPKMRRILTHNLAANDISSVVMLGSPFDAKSTSIDEFQLPKLDFVKIDLEGDAIRLIESARATLWKLRPVIFSAVRDPGDASEFAIRVKDCGYRCWRVQTRLFNPENFARHPSDVFNGRTALAVVGMPEEFDVGMALEGCVEL